MKRKVVIMKLPTTISISLCDLCNKELQEIKEYNGQNYLSEVTDYIYNLYVQHSSGDEEFDKGHVELCSLDCLEKWITDFKKEYPGLN